MRLREFAAVQRESTQVAGLLRKVLFSLRMPEAPSPVQGGFARSPSPSGGEFRTRSLPWEWSGWGSPRQYVLPRMGLLPITVGAAEATDRRNSTLRCYFCHCG